MKAVVAIALAAGLLADPVAAKAEYCISNEFIAAFMAAMKNVVDIRDITQGRHGRGFSQCVGRFSFSNTLTYQYYDWGYYTNIIGERIFYYSNKRFLYQGWAP